MSELIQMMDFEWPWTYEHIRTGVCFGLNVLGGGHWFIHAGRPALPLGTLTLDSSSGNVNACYSSTLCSSIYIKI